jgi:DNA polymerase-3 subunit alpha (Gram-positive type)
MVVIIFDLETSGLNPYHNDIIEIGAKVLNTDNSFQCLVKPKSKRAISKKITEITGITNKLLRDEGKNWILAYTEFYNWLYEAIKGQPDNVSFVSHNGLTFDFIFLKKLLLDLEREGGNNSSMDFNKFIFIDTLLLARRLLPERSYYSQPTLAKSFQIVNENAHRAMGDVCVLEQLYLRLVTEFNKQTKNDGLNETDKVLDYINLKI